MISSLAAAGKLSSAANASGDMEAFSCSTVIAGVEAAAPMARDERGLGEGEDDFSDDAPTMNAKLITTRQVCDPHPAHRPISDMEHIELSEMRETEEAGYDDLNRALCRCGSSGRLLVGRTSRPAANDAVVFNFHWQIGSLGRAGSSISCVASRS